MINPLWAELITSIINRVFLCGAEVNDLAERVKEKTKIFFLFQPFPCLTFGRLKKKRKYVYEIQRVLLYSCDLLEKKTKMETQNQDGICWFWVIQNEKEASLRSAERPGTDAVLT